MFVLGNFIGALARILDALLGLYIWVIIIRAVISWVHADPYHPLVRFLHAVTEPILAPLRRLFPLRGVGLDLSPMIALLIIYFLRSFLVRTLFELAERLR